ncbi:ABC transporter substrate-binding protein [Cryobacterium tepidiphilum]|nr:ABC transporter substrate-binding protein [Cryobacterium tepidiphilum]
MFNRYGKSAVMVASAAIVVAGLSGCASGKVAGGSSSTETGSCAGSPTSGTIGLIGYADIWQKQYQDAVIKPFEAKYPDIKVEYQSKRSSSDMLAALQSQGSSPTTDVAIMDSAVAASGNKQGLFQKISEADVPNVAHVKKDILDTGDYGPVLQADAVGLLYDTTKVPSAPTSWNILWDPQYKQKVSVVAPPSGLGINLTMITAKMEGEDFTKSIDKAVDRLKELAPNVQTWAPLPDEYQNIITGQTVLGMGQNARGQYYSDQSNGKLGIAFPKEGTMYQINTINLLKNAPNCAAAKTFMNYALSPEAQVAFAKALFYAPSVDNAELPADVADRVVKTDGSIDIITYDPEWLATVRSDWTDIWKREIIGG